MPTSNPPASPDQLAGFPFPTMNTEPPPPRDPKPITTPRLPSDALPALFALMDARNAAKAEQDACERREREDRKLATLKAWWIEAQQ